MEYERYIVRNKNGEYLLFYESEEHEFSPDICDADRFCSYEHAVRAIEWSKEIYNDMQICRIKEIIEILEENNI